MDIWVFGCFECFINVLFKVKLPTNLKFLQMLFYQKRPSEAFLYRGMVIYATTKSIGYAQRI
jgi:hypothetical protein